MDPYENRLSRVRDLLSSSRRRFCRTTGSSRRSWCRQHMSLLRWGRRRDELCLVRCLGQHGGCPSEFRGGHSSCSRVSMRRVTVRPRLGGTA